MEGHTYSCEWDKCKQRYRLWVTAHPSVRAEEADFDECRDLLAMEIAEKLGDVEPTLEFARYPPSILPGRYAYPRYVWLGRNAPGHLAGPVESVFRGGVCPVCQRPRGDRTSNPILVRTIPAGADCLNIRRLNVAVYSKRLLELVGVAQSPEFLLVPIDAQDRSKTLLYELRPRSSQALLAPVAVKSFPAQRRAWKCGECLASGISYDTGVDLIEFVSASEAMARRGASFVFEGRLCIPSKTWIQLSRSNKFKDVYARPLGMAEDDDIEKEVSFTVIQRQ